MNVFDFFFEFLSHPPRVSKDSQREFLVETKEKTEDKTEYRHLKLYTKPIERVH